MANNCNTDTDYTLSFAKKPGYMHYDNEQRVVWTWYCMHATIAEQLLQIFAISMKCIIAILVSKIIKVAKKYVNTILFRSL